MSEAGELYTIGQVARRVGVPARTIRFWCDAGILAPTDRSAGGYRRYDATAVARLDMVRTLRDLGLSLDEIRAVLRGRTTVAELASAHVAALDAQIRVLRLRRAVLRTVAARGSDIEEAKLIPLLKSIPEAWQYLQAFEADLPTFIEAFYAFSELPDEEDTKSISSTPVKVLKKPKKK